MKEVILDWIHLGMISVCVDDLEDTFDWPETAILSHDTPCDARQLGIANLVRMKAVEILELFFVKPLESDCEKHQLCRWWIDFATSDDAECCLRQ